ncbi:unnamed protein product [Sphagnum balticum]
MQPPGGDKVVSPGRVLSLGETLRPGMMVSLRIGCSTTGRGEWGSPGSIGVAFPVKGGGWGLGSGLFLRVGWGSREEVGLPGGRCGGKAEKKEWGYGFWPGGRAVGSPGQMNEWV